MHPTVNGNTVNGSIVYYALYIVQHFIDGNGFLVFDVIGPSTQIRYDTRLDWFLHRIQLFVSLIETLCSIFYAHMPNIYLLATLSIRTGHVIVIKYAFIRFGCIIRDEKHLHNFYWLLYSPFFCFVLCIATHFFGTYLLVDNFYKRKRGDLFDDHTFMWRTKQESDEKNVTRRPNEKIRITFLLGNKIDRKPYSTAMVFDEPAFGEYAFFSTHSLSFSSWWCRNFIAFAFFYAHILRTLYALKCVEWAST